MKFLTPEEITHHLVKEFHDEDPNGERLGRSFRRAFDHAYDGRNTGRYSISQLSKTESAHIGSLVEIHIRREFDGFINDGESMDFEVDGYEVDCKYSKNPFGWMIPMEAMGHHMLLCHADDQTALFRVGVMYVEDQVLTRGGNRDGKRSVAKSGRETIEWIYFDHPFPPNTLLMLPEEERESILRLKSGQQRVTQLCRVALEKRIPRGTIETVAKQLDSMKRLRGNGGARSLLRPEGIVILGHYRSHQQIAHQLELPVPQKGDSVPVRIFPAEPGFGGPTFELDGIRYRKAKSGEIHEAPDLPAF